MEQRREMTSLRTPQLEALYRKVLRDNKGRALADLPAKKTYKYWKIVRNEFPYDAFFQEHDLLIPKREVGDKEKLYAIEKLELEYILVALARDYDCFMENTQRKRTVPSHFHMHLLIYKKD
jgi:hypothetical protein